MQKNHLHCRGPEVSEGLCGGCGHERIAPPGILESAAGLAPAVRQDWLA